MTLETLALIKEAVNERPAELQEARKNGSKVVGYLCCYIPEEIITALGLIPVRLGRGGNERLVELGGHYISTQNCVFVRETLGLFLEKNDSYVKNTDIVAVSASCMQIYRAAELIRYYAKSKTIILGVPRNFYTDEGREYFRKEMKWFVENMEKIAGKKLDNKKLEKSIELHNNIRKAIAEIYRFQAQEIAPITWREVFDVIHAGFYLDRTRYLSFLNNLLLELNQKNTEPKLKSNSQPRILLSGSIISPGDTKLINLIDEMGGRIVADDICTGLRPIVNINVKSPTVQGIADAYLDRIPCASLPYLPSLETDKRLQNLSNLIDTYQPDGMIYHTLRFCDAFSFKANETKNYFKDRLSFMEIHTEYAGSDIEGVRTRVEAFLEMLREEKERKL